MGYDDNTIDEGSEVVYNCHSQCDSQGCYGPEDTQCISCANYKLNKSVRNMFMLEIMSLFMIIWFFSPSDFVWSSVNVI